MGEHIIVITGISKIFVLLILGSGCFQNITVIVCLQICLGEYESEEQSGLSVKV